MSSIEEPRLKRKKKKKREIMENEREVKEVDEWRVAGFWKKYRLEEN